MSLGRPLTKDHFSNTNKRIWKVADKMPEDLLMEFFTGNGKDFTSNENAIEKLIVE